MNKIGNLDFGEVIGLIVLGIFILIFIPILTAILNSISGGNIENSLNTIVEGFIPLFIFAAIFEFLRRFFK